MPDMPMSKPKRAGSESGDMNRPSPSRDPMDRFCANRAEVEIKDVDRYYQNIAGIHHIMVAGNYIDEVSDAMSFENVEIIGPIDSDASV